MGSAAAPRNATSSRILIAAARPPRAAMGSRSGAASSLLSARARRLWYQRAHNGPNVMTSAAATIR